MTSVAFQIVNAKGADVTNTHDHDDSTSTSMKVIIKIGDEHQSLDDVINNVKVDDTHFELHFTINTNNDKNPVICHAK